MRLFNKKKFKKVLTLSALYVLIKISRDFPFEELITGTSSPGDTKDAITDVLFSGISKFCSIIS